MAGYEMLVRKKGNKRWLKYGSPDFRYKKDATAFVKKMKTSYPKKEFRFRKASGTYKR